MKDQQYIDILKQLTLEEKASLCSGESFWFTKAIERLGVPSVNMTDGPHGLRKENDTIKTKGTNLMKPSYVATCFPPAVTSASTWDPSLLEEMGDAIGKEAKALGVTTVLGPGVNIKRSPLCGRNFEYFSEDPCLAGIMGAGWVRGVQKNGVGVSLKHYAANNQESLRMSVDTLVDERALREIYLAAFEHIVKTEQPSTIMCSYNRLDGEYLSDHKRMLTDILRKEWGFRGIVVSDWGAVNDRVAGIKAGLDLEMPGNGGLNDKKIVEAVNNGTLSEAELDKCVYRMIKFAYECKENEVPGFKADLDKHHELAKKIAAQGAVLLKNENKTLPIKGGSIAVIGALAEKLRYQGAGSSFINSYKTVSFKQALDNAGENYAYAAGYSLEGTGHSKKLLKEALETAKGKDTVLVFIGLTDEYESEGFDRKHIKMPESHYELVEELAKVNQNIIVVLSCGSPVRLDRVEYKAKAILNLYLGGQAGGEAAYDIIFGKVNPSGKLAETFPARNHHNIAALYFPMGPRTVEYRESIYVGYRYFDSAKRDALYPFGFGLSYTSFEYSGLKLSAKQIEEGETLTVKFTVKNTGDVAGAETAQVYVSDIESSIFRPEKELKGFVKVFLNAGEEKEVSVSLDSRSFAYYNVLIKDWHIESGDFDITVGASSKDIKLEEKVTVISANADAPIPDYHATAPFYYDLIDENGKPKTKIPAEQYAALYGDSLIENKPFVKGEFTINNTVEQVSVSRFGRFLYWIMRKGAAIMAKDSENKAMLTESVKDLPLRGFSGFSGGILTDVAVEGIVDMCNGKRGGFKKLRRGLHRK